MRFHEHSGFENAHAFLSPSGYHWLNYDPEKLLDRYATRLAAARGTQLHDLAHKAISLGVPLDGSNGALADYVADAIEFEMVSEQPLVYSKYCFGTADAISFEENHLRIFDLKTGESQTSMKQLLVYAALFCLEYDVDPRKIECTLRIYQVSRIVEHIPQPQEIEEIMDVITKHVATVEEFYGDL